MPDKISQRLDLLKHKERELRDQTAMSQSSLDNTVQLDKMLSAVTSEIVQLESASQKPKAMVC